QPYLEFVWDLVNNFNRWCAACSVDNLANLHDLIILEQFKNSVPLQIAPFLTEQQVKNVLEAVQLADQYVLIHHSEMHLRCIILAIFKQMAMVVSLMLLLNLHQWSLGSLKDFTTGINSAVIVTKKGHVKTDCRALKEQKQQNANSAAAAVPVSAKVRHVAVVGPGKESSTTEKAYSPFITHDFVSLTEGGERVPVRILRDTGALDSFILVFVLHFSNKTDISDSGLLNYFCTIA
ncbi:hypothetical protein LDENG_00212940, partial [Lucifuga dentata]